MMLCNVRRTGFSLIEIMIVVAIIAILAGIVLPNMMQARAEAQLAACRQNILTIADALCVASVRHTSYEMLVQGGGNIHHGVVDYLVENGYLQSAPKCPSTGVMYGVLSAMTGITSAVLKSNYHFVIMCSNYNGDNTQTSYENYGKFVHNIDGQRLVPKYFMNQTGSFRWDDKIIE